MSKKTGRLTVEEINFIVSSKDKMTIEEMALALDRRPGVISDYVHQNLGVTKPQSIDIEAKYHLRSRPFYKHLCQQFTNEELDVLDYHYKKMYAQFKDDVFHTEEMQILDICKLEILCERILKSQGESRRKIVELETEIALEKSAPKQTWNLNAISNCERQIAALQVALKTTSDEYRDFMARKATALKDIKGTRDQRFKTIEDNKQTWTSLLTKLSENAEFRKQVGLDMEKYRLAANEERERLSQQIVYDNGEVDRPLLNDKSVKL